MRRLIEWQTQSDKFKEGVGATIDALYRGTPGDVLPVLDDFMRKSGLQVVCANCCEEWITAVDVLCDGCGISRDDALQDLKEVKK